VVAICWDSVDAPTGYTAKEQKKLSGGNTPPGKKRNKNRRGAGKSDKARPKDLKHGIGRLGDEKKEHLRDKPANQSAKPA